MPYEKNCILTFKMVFKLFKVNTFQDILEKMTSNTFGKDGSTKINGDKNP